MVWLQRAVEVLPARQRPQDGAQASRQASRARLEGALQPNEANGMITFTVHEPPDPPADRIDRAESLVFIKDGFSWVAAIFAPIWLIAYRLWWPLLGVVVLMACFELVKRMTDVDQRWVGLAGLALNLMIGFEADSLRRWALERRGWRMLGSVTGKTAAECERRFFETWLPSQPIIAPRADPPTRRSWRRLGGLIGARS
jgi:Protein of unknown function (DUF2628)